MSLKDVLIMEVPFGAMKSLARSKAIEAKFNVVEDVASALSENEPASASNLADEFKFAGSTAINLNIMMNGIPAEWHSKEYFIDKLRDKFSGALFTRGLRPMLNDKPKLIRAYDHGEKLVLAFSYFGKARRYLEDFEIVTRRQQVVEYVIIRFAPFAVEVRAGQDRNKIFRDAVLEIMGIEEEVVWDKVTKLTDEQANLLALKLGARLRAAKHKMIEGVYATKEVTANTQVEDLESTEEYQKEFSKQPMKKKTLIFDYKYSFGYEEAVSYVVTDGGLWIRSRVGEEVISHILDHIIKIRHPEEVDNDVMDDDDPESFSEILELPEDADVEETVLESDF